MTQQVYEKPLEDFQENKIPEKWSTVDVMSRGRLALEEANLSMGNLNAFDTYG